MINLCKMQVCFYFSILIVLGYQNFTYAEDVGPYDIKDDITALIDSLRDEIPEVITISSLDVDLEENEYLTGHLNVNNGEIKGLKEFIADINYLFVIPTSFTLTLESVTANLEYLADLALFNIPLLSIFGEGTGRVAITNLEVVGKISYKLSPISLSVNSVHISLGDAQFAFEGLLNDEIFNNLLNKVLNDNFAKLINDNEGAISSVLEDAINTIIGDLLSNSATKGIFDNQTLINNNSYTEEEGFVKVFEILIEALKSLLK